MKGSFLKHKRIKIFADGAEYKQMCHHYKNPLIEGFTTNPTLMSRAGVLNYKDFARNVLRAIPDKPVSLEVIADDLSGMHDQALVISSWGNNVYAKIPITNTKGESTLPIISMLRGRIKLNVTCIFTLDQAIDAIKTIGYSTAYISILHGRISDTGTNPIPIMHAALDMMRHFPNQELLCAGPRRVYDVAEADRLGCHIVTIDDSIIDKLPLLGMDPKDYSLETIRMFNTDAVAQEYTI